MSFAQAFTAAVIDVTHDSPLAAIFTLSLLTALLCRKLYQLHQRLQNSYDEKAD